jgi:triphosphatase
MQLELAADEDAAAGLFRLKALAASRDGRARSQSMKIVWYDNPEHALFADGLVLAEQRNLWRLERIAPAEDTWLPSQPVPVLAEAPDATTVLSDPAVGTVAEPLAPLAAFEGRQTASNHQFDGQVVVITSAKGVLRSVAAERQVARIWISGEEQAVRVAALAIANAIPLSVPLTSMAAEAIALATGRPANPRRHGAPVLPASVTGVAEALRHILGHLTDVILAHAPSAVQEGDAGPEAVHQMRVAVRRARSALSIFRPALPEGALELVSDRLKTLGRSLGPTRDWDVFVDETAAGIQAAIPDDERLERLVAAAARRRRTCQQSLATYLKSPDFRVLGIELAWFVAAGYWHPREEVPDANSNQPPELLAFADRILQHRWKKLVSAGKRIEELDIASLHDVRLRAKRARYAAEMFATLHQGKASHKFIRRLSVLQQRLGVLNDGAVATHLMSELGGPGGRHGYATGLVTGFLAARGARTRPGIVRAFERFRRQPVYWD